MSSQSDDIIGNKFGEWTVIYETFERKKSDGSKYYLCKCKCGTEILKTKSEILRITSFRCRACHNAEVSEKKVLKNNEKYIGSQIGVWKIIGHTYHRNISMYIGKCPCGTIRTKPLKSFTLFKGCAKCCPKKINLKSRREYYLRKAEERLGKVVGSFKLLNIAYVKNSLIYITCKCLFCKKNTDIPNGVIPFRESCGCLREKNKKRGSEQHNAKLTEIEVSAIKELYSSGLYSKKELSNQFGVRSIYSIINGETWKHVK